ncbi:transcriptional regulator, SarA/Rot family, partial [Staphylococcus simiae]
MRLDEDTLNKVNRFIDIESYIYYLTRELKQKSEFSLKELLILAYIFYKGENNISLKEIISDILCKQSEIVQIIKSLAKKEYIEKSRNTSDERRIYISVNSIQQELISNKIKFLDNIIFKFNLKNNYSSKSWVP